MQPSPTARTTEARPAPLDVGSLLGAVPHVGSQRVADSSGWRGPRSPLPTVQLQAGLVKATGVDLVWDGPSGHGGPGASTPQSCRTHRFVALVEGVGEQHPTRGLGRPLCCAAHGTAGTGLHRVTAGELRQGGIRSETSHCCRAVLGVGWGHSPKGAPQGAGMVPISALSVLCPAPYLRVGIQDPPGVPKAGSQGGNVPFNPQEVICGQSGVGDTARALSTATLCSPSPNTGAVTHGVLPVGSSL